ncbi:hypothetical protein E2P81_ATG07065 [Venturia nashicola]|uniref:Uncharacterized protein n=1 Tax=Venturia nashicola TaxID=86259 RepID=A0A4Z1NSV3_9PEZI|nr:hypothetical protein E6O75_ATG07230 [Venturia nashicola]TLD19448.1 hypothetical protein E2P81_ATG07065 [Venturia nashicola]
MKLFNIVILALVAAVSAKTNGTHNHEHESVPNLKKACDCPSVNCPSALMNVQSVCRCKNAAALACYKKSQGGCPVPVNKAPGYECADFAWHYQCADFAWHSHWEKSNWALVIYEKEL